MWVLDNSPQLIIKRYFTPDQKIYLLWGISVEYSFLILRSNSVFLRSGIDFVVFLYMFFWIVWVDWCTIICYCLRVSPQNQLYQGYNLTACVHWYVDYTRRRIWYSLYRNEYMHLIRTNTVEFNSDYVVSIKHFRNFLS